MLPAIQGGSAPAKRCSRLVFTGGAASFLLTPRLIYVAATDVV
jgi:hypothetical protein